VYYISQVLENRGRRRTRQTSSGEPVAPQSAANQSENRGMSETGTLQQPRRRGTLIPNVRQYYYKYSNLVQFITDAESKI